MQKEEKEIEEEKWGGNQKQVKGQINRDEQKTKVNKEGRREGRNSKR